ncbi:MAG: hypothetical protein KDB90_12730 [Planctomycetes bacterium]|nr:hypothetical protein [Planctomycetota bacterium]
MLHSIAVSNRFVAENIATHSASQLAARALTQGAIERGISIAFTSSLAFGPLRNADSRREIELIAEDLQWLTEIPGFRTGAGPGRIKHSLTGVPLLVHTAGSPILGGPVCWPDPSDADIYCGIPVLRLNSFLESELARALNSPVGPCYEANVVAAILQAGAGGDRSHELHPYVSERYLDLWERAQSLRIWPAVA